MARMKTSSTDLQLRSDMALGGGLVGKAARAIGLGKGKSKTAKRHRKILKDTIEGVTRGDIRRLARRGGVKRMSAQIYPNIRLALKEHLRVVVHDVALVTDVCGRKTVATSDVVWALKRRGTSLYGFGEATGSSLRKKAS